MNKSAFAFLVLFCFLQASFASPSIHISKVFETIKAPLLILGCLKGISFLLNYPYSRMLKERENKLLDAFTEKFEGDRTKAYKHIKETPLFISYTLGNSPQSPKFETTRNKKISYFFECKPSNVAPPLKDLEDLERKTRDNKDYLEGHRFVPYANNSSTNLLSQSKACSCSMNINNNTNPNITSISSIYFSATSISPFLVYSSQGEDHYEKIKIQANDALGIFAHILIFSQSMDLLHNKELISEQRQKDIKGLYSAVLIDDQFILSIPLPNSKEFTLDQKHHAFVQGEESPYVYLFKNQKNKWRKFFNSLLKILEIAVLLKTGHAFFKKLK